MTTATTTRSALNVRHACALLFNEFGFEKRTLSALSRLFFRPWIDPPNRFVDTR
nr:hypothetical protein [Microbacterium testaceum]